MRAEGVALGLARTLSEEAAGVVEGRPVYGRADRVSGNPEREITFSGKVQMRRDGTVVHGERITYNKPDDTIVAVGAVRVAREGNVFTGPELHLKLDTNEGFFNAPSFVLARYGGRGDAERIDFLGDGRFSMKNASYTACRPGDDSWRLEMGSLLVDEGRQEASGRSARLRLGGATVLQAPWFAFPIGDERRSGVLTPSFALTSRSGPEVLVPYYWNIAPNRDFTLYPRVTTRRGVQLGGQFRYLEPWSNGDLRFEYAPHDSVTSTSRSFYSVQSAFAGVAGWSGTVTARSVSDDEYFVDYSRSILASSERSLPRELVATRALGEFSLLVRATRYQNILDARLAPPYERVPQVALTWQRRGLRGFDADLVVDATEFRRPLAGSVQGTRLFAYPRVSYPIVRPGWFVTPRFGVHLSAYQLESNAGMATTLERAVPIVSIDSGMIFERRTTLFGREVTQTLEPRLFYARVPYRDQSAFPVFDSGVADFNFAQLFSENTFIGNDRIADVNRLTAAVVTRLIEPSNGVQTLRLALGQRRYLSAERVSLPGIPNLNDGRSDFLFAASAQITATTSLDAGLQYGTRDARIPRFSMLWRYLPADGRVLNLGVRHLRNDLGQIDASWRWPIAPNWVALGRVNYSWLRERADPTSGVLVSARPGIVEGLAGFEYTADCWATRFVVQRFVTSEGRTTSAVFVQLELNGLARIGTDPFDILRRNIPGYRPPVDRPPLPSRFFGYE